MKISQVRYLKMRLGIALLEYIQRPYCGHFDPLAAFAFDHIGNRINVCGIYEIEELETLMEYLRAKQGNIFSGCALDVGANIGNHALYFSRFFPKVYAFEPNPVVFELLQFNADQFKKNDVECYNVGLSDRVETLRLNIIDPINTGRATFLGNKSEVGMECKLCNIDNVVAIKEKVSIVKIDVEGYEQKVLEGLRSIILRDFPIIIFEQYAHEFANGSSPTIDLLKSCGYRFSVIATTLNPKNPFLKLILRSIFGVTLSVKPIQHFPTCFYPMIIAEKKA